MQKDEIDAIKGRINKKLEQLEEQIHELKELTKPVAPDVAIGRVSRMDAINNKSVNEMALRQAKEKKVKLHYALDLVDKPNYGKCSGCGSQIPAGRLMAMPESTKCVNCQNIGF